MKPANGISCLRVRGFKSIKTEQEIAIRPLTVLAGANSSGKSSIMQPLLLLKQTLEAAGDPGALLLDGDHVKFSRAEQALSRDSASKFEIEIGLVSGSTLRLVFAVDKGRGFDLKEMVSRVPGKSVTLRPDMSRESIVAMLPEHLHRFDGRLRDAVAAKGGGSQDWAVRRQRCFLVCEPVPFDPIFARVLAEAGIGFSPGRHFVENIEGILHLPGLRGNPRRTYPRRAVGPKFEGTFDDYVASVIAAWQEEKDSAKLKALGQTLEQMGLSWKVSAEPVDDIQVELKVGRLPHGKRGGAHDLVSIADVGFGVSQALPVLVALLAARPGQLVYLEQPEIHLHPLAQRKLASVLLGAVKRGVLSVVETHSALLLREIQTLVAAGEIDKKDVAMHWFKRDEGGNTTVQTAKLDENGAYGDWPEDFDETDLASEKAYLDAIEAKGALG